MFGIPRAKLKKGMKVKVKRLGAWMVGTITEVGPKVTVKIKMLSGEKTMLVSPTELRSV